MPSSPGWPPAPVVDLNLELPEAEDEWLRRLDATARGRLAQARARLERLGLLDTGGAPTSAALPPDLDPEGERGGGA